MGPTKSSVGKAAAAKCNILKLHGPLPWLRPQRGALPNLATTETDASPLAGAPNGAPPLWRLLFVALSQLDKVLSNRPWT